MAGLASHAGVLALSFQCCDRFVTRGARLMPRVTQWAVAVVVNRTGAKVAQTAEIRRYQSLPKH